MGWLFRGCFLAVFAMGVLLALLILGALGVIDVPMKGISTTFCIIAAVIFVLPVIGLLVLRMWLGKLAKSVAEGIGALGGMGSMPAEVTLVRRSAESEPWEKTAKFTQAESQLASLGFVDAGEWDIEEMPNVKMHAFFKPADNLWATVNEMTGVGVFLDVVLNYTDEGSTTWTNAANAGLMDPMPGHEKIKDVDADAVRLYEMFKSHAITRPVAQAKASDFKAVFEKAYQREMAWRTARGGTTREEVKRIALAGGQDVSDETIDELTQQERAEAMDRLDTILRKAFVESNQLSASRWESVRDRVVFIHDQLTVEEALELVPLPDEAEEAWEAPAGVTSAREAFARVNATLPPRQQCELLGRLETPSPCDVYAEPEYVEE